MISMLVKDLFVNGFWFSVIEDPFTVIPDILDVDTVEALENGSKELGNAYAEAKNQFNQIFENGFYRAYDVAKLAYKYNLKNTRIEDRELLFALKSYMLTDFARKMIYDQCEWVYVLKAFNYNLCKIGMTKRSPRERLGEFSPKLPFKTFLLKIIPSMNAMGLEKELHEKYKDKRRNGEWFELDKSDYSEIGKISISPNEYKIGTQQHFISGAKT